MFRETILTLEAPVQQAARLSFERAVGEFARWRAVPSAQRSPAPAWWWGPAFEALGIAEPMPAGWCAILQLPDGSSVAEGAEVFLTSFAGQTSLPWPHDFPGRVSHSNPA